jgi:mRNA-degrading endonuclease RelE of RelBE toxin-antitoxin system
MNTSNIEIYEVESLPGFKKDIRRLVKKKKYNSLPSQVADLVSDLEKGVFSGTHIIHKDAPAKFDVYKLRLPNIDDNVGKSNGFRLIYTVITDTHHIFLITLYHKKEIGSVSDEYIEGVIDTLIAIDN